MRKRWLVCLCLSSMVVGSAWGQAPADLAWLRSNVAGPRTQVLVLGTAHLSQAPKDFKPESLAPVLDRLAAFKPQIITVEQISGEGCDLAARHPAVYDPKDMETYCADPVEARKATGLNVPAAIAQVQSTWKAWPEHPTPAQRRHLAALFMAANDNGSAMVQWLQLPAAERHVGDGLDSALVAAMSKRENSRNETYVVAARLAAKLGLQRLYSVDDHTGDNVQVDNDKAYGDAIQGAWNGAADKLKPVLDREQSLLTSGDMLTMYRYINDPAVLRIGQGSDFGAALGDANPPHYGRMYVAGWETRNLRMAANVLATFRETPGARVLSIVGSSHKPWLDSLLGQMPGVEIVDAEQVLK